MFDEEGSMRQRCIEIDDRTGRLRDLIADSPWSWSEFEEMYDISWIFHENGLEGVVLTYPEIKSAVDNKIISDVSLLPTYKHIKDQKWCIDQMRERAGNRRAVINIPFLKDLHGRLVDDPEVAGTYRKDIPIHRTYFHEIAQPQTIPDGLGAVLDYLKGRHSKDMHAIELAGNVHHRFMRVFPFSRFSGMIGRLLINFVLHRAGYLPAVIHATDRQRYYEALRGPERHFRRFLAGAMENSLDNALRFLAQQQRAGA
jgi:Fic family protein